MNEKLNAYQKKNYLEKNIYIVFNGLLYNTLSLLLNIFFTI